MTLAAPLARPAQVVRIADYRPKPGFTGRDLRELQRWAARGGRFDVGETGDEENPGQFATLYEAGQAYASWALLRREGSIVVWNCATLRDLGRFDGMAAALAALPGAVFVAADWGWSADVIPFRAAR